MLLISLVGTTTLITKIIEAWSGKLQQHVFNWKFRVVGTAMWMGKLITVCHCRKEEKELQLFMSFTKGKQI